MTTAVDTREAKYLAACRAIALENLAKYSLADVSHQCRSEIEAVDSLEALLRILDTNREVMPSKNQRICERVTNDALRRIEMVYGRTPQVSTR